MSGKIVFTVVASLVIVPEGTATLRRAHDALDATSFTSPAPMSPSSGAALPWSDRGPVEVTRLHVAVVNHRLGLDRLAVLVAEHDRPGNASDCPESSCRRDLAAQFRRASTVARVSQALSSPSGVRVIGRPLSRACAWTIRAPVMLRSAVPARPGASRSRPPHSKSSLMRMGVVVPSTM